MNPITLQLIPYLITQVIEASSTTLPPSLPPRALSPSIPRTTAAPDPRPSPKQDRMVKQKKTENKDWLLQNKLRDILIP